VMIRQRKKDKDIVVLNEEEKEPLIKVSAKDYYRGREYERDEDIVQPPSTTTTTLSPYYSYLSIYFSSFWDYFSQFWTELRKIVLSNSNATLPSFDPIVKQRMAEYQKHISLAFNMDDPTHHNDLVKLWQLFFSEPFPLQSPDWKKLGFQSENPLSDFRASGIFGLKNILYFAEKYPTKFQLLVDIHGQRPGGGYPFAIASFNVTMMICELLGWGWKRPGISTAKDQAVFRKLVTMLFSDNYSLDLAENIFSEFYCLALVETDSEWFESKAGYMDFPVVIANSQTRLEKLVNSFSGIEDLFSYNRMNLSG